MFQLFLSLLLTKGGLIESEGFFRTELRSLSWNSPYVEPIKTQK
jgi:hypothetical protein